MDINGFTAEAALPEGDVLIIGSGQTGCQLAEELQDAGRRVIFSKYSIYLDLGDILLLVQLHQARSWSARSCTSWLENQERFQTLDFSAIFDLYDRSRINNRQETLSLAEPLL